MPSPTIVPYVDGWFGPERELSVVPQPKFPFKDNPITPDTYSRTYDRKYEAYPRLFLPKIANRTTWANLLTYSEAFDNAAWTKVALTVTADNVTAPDGNLTMDKLLETAATSAHSVSQAATVTNAATELLVFGKVGLNRSWIKLGFTDSGATVFSGFFNIESGYVGTLAGGATGKIIGLGNGHFCAVLNFTPAAGAGTFKVELSTNGSTTSYAGDTSKGVYLWGAQVATGTLAPYIPTTSTTRTVIAPDRDPTDPMAYLVDETDPAIECSEESMIERTFARIPLSQTLPNSQYVTKPPLPGAFPQVIGSSLVMQPDSTQASYEFFTRNLITSDSGAPNGSYPTGGTYTITVGANTTGGFAYNADASTVQSTLNGVAAISNRGSVTVSGAYNTPGGFTITRAAYAAGTLDITSLTGTFTHTTSVTQGNNGQFSWFQIGNIATGSTITGGTFTITVFGQTTTALAYNCSVADIKAALEALSKIGVGNVDVQPPGDGGWGPNPLSSNLRSIKFYVGFTIPAISTNGASLTPSGSTSAVSMGGTYAGNTFASPILWNQFGIATLNFTGSAAPTRVFYAANHGISSTDTIYVKLGSTYYTLTSGSFIVVDANTIQIGSSAGTIFTDPAIATEMGRLSTTYTAGSVLSRVLRVTSFYVVGVTPGISTINDIPLPAWQGDAASMINAIFAGSTAINYEVGELVPWRGPILARTLTIVNASQL